MNEVTKWYVSVCLVSWVVVGGLIFAGLISEFWLVMCGLLTVICSSFISRASSVTDPGSGAEQTGARLGPLGSLGRMRSELKND